MADRINVTFKEDKKKLTKKIFVEGDEPADQPKKAAFDKQVENRAQPQRPSPIP